MPQLFLGIFDSPAGTFLFETVVNQLDECSDRYTVGYGRVISYHTKACRYYPPQTPLYNTAG